MSSRYVPRLLAFLLCLPAVAATSPHPVERTRIALAAAPAAPESVPRWDPDSPQRLVRIAGELYQEDAGFYYPVEPERISVRLADGVRDWNDFLERAAVVRPDLLPLLERLEPGRPNRLSILDLRLPDGDPADWAELVFRTGLVRYAEVSTVGVYLAVPNDPQYPQQWALHNTGQTGGIAGADIDAQAAWDLSAGDPSVVVGVLDSGTNVDHVDLALNVWHNAGETPANGVDDDGNGFIDDWEGWDFGNANNDPRSSNYHGTHVTGVINAAGNNGTGVVGLAGGLGAPGVRAMAIAVGESGPIASILDDAILYATDNGATVITMSLSVAEASAINDALAYAYGTADVFIDCAAGNSGASVAYPARRPEVMAVASTDDEDRRSSFSNPGPELEVAAPGSSILSTQLGNTYGTSSGTSFAAPYVAALAALVRGLNPGLPAPEVRQLIIDSSEDVETPGFDNLTGHGRINAFQALSMTATSDGRLRLDADRYSCSDTITVSLTDVDLAGLGAVVVQVRSDTETLGEPLVLAEIGTALFRGEIGTAAGFATADGTLQLAHAESIVAEYVDADDGAGGTNVPKLAGAASDCAAPLILDVTLEEVDDQSAEIRFSTDEEASATVRYGTAPPPVGVSAPSSGATEHAISLSGLAPCTTYVFEVRAEDDLGNASVEDNGGLFYRFETFASVPGVGVVPCHAGRVTLDRNVYGCGDTALVSVADIDLDVDPGLVESTSVLLTSSSEPGGEWVLLTEVGPANARFDGTIDLTGAPAAGDGMLSASPGDLITATYFDQDDGQGVPGVAVYTSVADCVAPAIGDLRVAEITATQVVVEWTTDEPASSRIEYGPDAGLGQVVEDATPKTSHRLALGPFAACERVHFRVSSADARGELRVADAAGEPFVLELRRIGGGVFHDDFETSKGWTLPDGWERAVPVGLGSGSGDPAAAYNGSTILGTDLSGSGAFPGDYEPTDKKWAISPVFDASGASDLELILRRKLGVTGSDTAAIVLLRSGTHTVWSSGGAIDDADWTEVRYDVSAIADGGAAVRVAIGVESIDPGQSYGWNVDELVVKDATEPDYAACGGCADAPAFAGATVAFDPQPCAGSGLIVAWEPAVAWGSGAGGTYEVHRGTTPDFAPGPGNLVASGVTGASWSDAGAPVDTPVWYVVRARNDESCGGGVGLADANEVRVAATETVTRPVPGPVAPTMRAAAVGDAHVRLTWDPVADAAGYVIRRSDDFSFAGATVLATVTETWFEDPLAAVEGPSRAYRVTAVNACE